MTRPNLSCFRNRVACFEALINSGVNPSGGLHGTTDLSSAKARLQCGLDAPRRE